MRRERGTMKKRRKREDAGEKIRSLDLFSPISPSNFTPFQRRQIDFQIKYEHRGHGTTGATRTATTVREEQSPYFSL